MGGWRALPRPADRNRAAPASAQSQAPDTILLNGKIVTYDAAAPARGAGGARRQDRRASAAPPTSARWPGPPRASSISPAAPSFPGLIDSHIHAIRAGLTFTTEVHWIGVRTLAEALEPLARRGKGRAEGLVARRRRRLDRAAVRGGPPADAGRDRRRRARPSRLCAAALQPRAAQSRRPRRARRSAEITTSPRGSPSSATAPASRPAGSAATTAPSATCSTCCRGRRFAQKVAGTRAFFRALNASALTGVIDPGGYNLPIADYQPLFQVWRERGLTLRVRLQPVRAAPRPRARGLPGADADACRWASATTGCASTASARTSPGACTTTTRRPKRRRSSSTEVLRWAASRGMTATFHWHNDRSVHHLLDVLERVNARDAGRAAALVDRASQRRLARQPQAHEGDGLGWLMQNAFYFRGEAFLGQRGAEAARLAPPIVSALRHGAAGRRRHRRAPGDVATTRSSRCNGCSTARPSAASPMRGAGGNRRRGSRRCASTRKAAPGSRSTRTSAARSRAGKLADLAVLSSDYLTVPVDEIGGIVVAAHHGRRPHRLCGRALSRRSRTRRRD